MKRRNLILSALALPLSPVFAAEAWIENLNNIFNSYNSLKADMLQYDPSGRTVTGRFYLLRPGLLRFEYDDKNRPLIISGHSVLAVFDPKSNINPKKYPIGTTPLSLLARNDIDLTSTKFVKSINQSPTTHEAKIEVTDPKHPEYGSLIIRIDAKTRQLKGFQSINRQGQRTTVELRNLQKNISLDKELFNIVKLQATYGQ